MTNKQVSSLDVSSAGSSISIGQASKYLGVSIDTLRRWEKAGKLQAQRLDGKNRYFLFSDLEQFKELQPYSTSQVATMLGLSESTVRRLEHEGKLAAGRDHNNKRLYDPMKVSEYVTLRERARQPLHAASFRSGFQPPEPSPGLVESPARPKPLTNQLADPTQFQQASPEPGVYNGVSGRKNLGLLLLAGWVFAALILFLSLWPRPLTQGPAAGLSSLQSATGSLAGLQKSASLTLPSDFFLDAANNWLS